jgi:hypothetical protein
MGKEGTIEQTVKYLERVVIVGLLGSFVTGGCVLVGEDLVVP